MENSNIKVTGIDRFFPEAARGVTIAETSNKSIGKMGYFQGTPIENKYKSTENYFSDKNAEAVIPERILVKKQRKYTRQ